MSARFLPRFASLLVAWLAFEGTARADEPPARSPTALTAAGTWYGWQTLSADAAALGMFVASTRRSLGWDGLDNPSTLVWLSAATFAVGGPAVHLAHGRPLPALASLGLRTVAPVGLFFGMSYATFALVRSDGEDNLGAAIFAMAVGSLGAATGMVGAIAADAGLLAREPAEPAKASNVAVGPAFDAAGHPCGVSLSGRLF